MSCCCCCCCCCCCRRSMTQSSGTRMNVNLIVGLCAVFVVAGAGASEERQGYEARSESLPLLKVSMTVASVSLGVVSILLMVCCGFLRRKGKTNGDMEAVAETGNSTNAAAGNNIRMGQQQSQLDKDVTANPREATSFTVQNEIGRVGPAEANGPQRQNYATTVGSIEAGGFKTPSNSVASFGSTGKKAAEVVTLVSRDVNGIGLNIREGTDGGILVKDVHPDGPAKESRRIRSGDHIVSMAISMENMTLDHAQTLLHLARFYPVELHFAKRPPDIVVHAPSLEEVRFPADAHQERGRSRSAVCLPLRDDDRGTKLDQNRSSSSCTHLPLPGQISRWCNESELNPELGVQKKWLTFEEDILTMSQLASEHADFDKNDEETATTTTKVQIDSTDPWDDGQNRTETVPPVVVGRLSAEYETPSHKWQNQRSNASSDVESEQDEEDEEEDAEDVKRIGKGYGLVDNIVNPGVPEADEASEHDDEESLAEPKWQSDFRIELPHLDVDPALEGSRPEAGSSAQADFNGRAMNSAFQGVRTAGSNLDEEKSEEHEETGVELNLGYTERNNLNAVETAELTAEMDPKLMCRNNRAIFNAEERGFDGDPSYRWNYSCDTGSEDQISDDDDEKKSISTTKEKTSEGMYLAAKGLNLDSELKGNAGGLQASNPVKIAVDRQALSSGVKADKWEDSYSDQGHEWIEGGIEGGISDDGEVKTTRADVGMEVGANAKADQPDPTGYFGVPTKSGEMNSKRSSPRSTDEFAFYDTRPSGSPATRNVSGPDFRWDFDGEQKQEAKVIRKGQTESYYERFCEAVETGLPDRVVDLDVVDEGHEDEEEEKKTGYEPELSLEVKKHDETAQGQEDTAFKTDTLSVKVDAQESRTASQKSGNLSPEIAIYDGQKQYPPQSKDSKGRPSMSFSDRLKDFFSPKRGAKGKDRGNRDEAGVATVRASDFTYSHDELPVEKSSTESVQLSPEDGASKSWEEQNSTGFEVGFTGAPTQGLPPQPEVSPSGGGGQGGIKEQLDEEAEQSWTNSSVENGPSATSSSPRLTLEYSSREKATEDVETTVGSENLDENGEFDRNAAENDYDYPRKLYSIEVENEERTEHKEPPPESHLPGIVYGRKDFREFYYGMAIYGNDNIRADGVKEEELKVDAEFQQKGYQVRPDGTENGNKVNGTSGYELSETESLSAAALQEFSSDDEDEVISYSLDVQTTFPADGKTTDANLPRGRTLESGKEKTDWKTSSAFPTSNRFDTFEFLDLNRFSLEPLELPSWESLGLSSQPSQLEEHSSFGSSATQSKTKEINLIESEDRNNNTLIGSSNA